MKHGGEARKLSQDLQEIIAQLRIHQNIHDNGNNEDDEETKNKLLPNLEDNNNYNSHELLLMLEDLLFWAI
jgi:hypothetical protein